MKLVVYYILLTNILVMASDQCNVHHFRSPFYPGESCEDIYDKNPESHHWSGYYWITNGLRKVYCGMTYIGSSCEDIYNNHPETGDRSGYYRIANSTWTFCNMTAIANGFISTCGGIGGGWQRIAHIDISAGDTCPSGWRQDTNSGISFCRIVSDGYQSCSSAYFSTNGTSYQRVCGRARGYQKGVSHSFLWGYRESQTIDGYYVEGLSITYGNPRKHLWTYAQGNYDNRTDPTNNCPCAGGSSASPSFVGLHYYCESGSVDTNDRGRYYFNDPTWDGRDCYSSTDCCNGSIQPWFYRELNGSTTSPVEARICRWHAFHDGSTLIDLLELYIQ